MKIQCPGGQPTLIGDISHLVVTLMPAWLTIRTRVPEPRLAEHLWPPDPTQRPVYHIPFPPRPRALATRLDSPLPALPPPRDPAAPPIPRYAPPSRLR